MARVCTPPARWLAGAVLSPTGLQLAVDQYQVEGPCFPFSWCPCRTAANSHNSSSACGSSDEDFEGDMRSRRNGARGAGQHVHSWEVGDSAHQHLLQHVLLIAIGCQMSVL